MTPYLRGALVEFVPTGLIPIPNVIIFQYNPESMVHSWSQPEQASNDSGARNSNPLAVQGNPGETFTFTIFLDAADSIADTTASADLASVSGVYSRIAALEMLLYPRSATSGGGILGAVTAGILGGHSSGTDRQVPSTTMNTVLFVWGPGRIVPVRVTGLQITEKLYDGLLNPTRAEVQVTLRVFTAEELTRDRDPLAPVARAANTYTMALRRTLAEANLVNSGESIVGMLSI